MIYRFDDSGWPVRLGPEGVDFVLRSPSYTYHLYGIDYDLPVKLDNGELVFKDKKRLQDPFESWLRIMSDFAFFTEWEGGTPEQMKDVETAAKMAGLGNCSDMLRETQAKTIYHIVNLPRFKNLERINYTEPGAGISTVMVYKYLIDNGYDIDRIYATLIEPSRKRVFGDEKTKQEGFVKKLEDLGLEEGKHFNVIIGKDSEMLFYLGENSQHIITDNATRHHHAFLDDSARSDYAVIAPGGFLNRSDWFEGLCEHPGRVYKAFRDHELKPPVEWKTKERDLENFVKAFPRALEPYPRFSPEDEMAVDMIDTFWFDGYAVRRAKRIQEGSFHPCDEYFFMEPHGRPEIQFAIVKNAGFEFDTEEIKHVTKSAGLNGNPHQILTKSKMEELGMDRLYKNIPEGGSNLLMTFNAQKPL